MLSILIAALNEEETIERCLTELSSIPNSEIILVHGGTDRTAEVAMRFRDSGHPSVRVVRNYGDVGKGHALKTAISLAQGDVMVQFDADLQFSARDISKVVAPILNAQADLVIGSRFMKGAERSDYRGLWARDLGNRVVNGWISFLCQQKITDVTSGLKAWSRRAIWEISYRDNRFAYEMEIVFRAVRRGLRVTQVPVYYANRAGGVSGHGSGFREAISLIRTGLRIITGAARIRFGAHR